MHKTGRRAIMVVRLPVLFQKHHKERPGFASLTGGRARKYGTDDSPQVCPVFACHPVEPALKCSYSGLLNGISLSLFLSKDPDAGSGSGMTGRDCHPVVILYGISFFSFGSLLVLKILVYYSFIKGFLLFEVMF
jgi:hypothetical protein